VQSRGVFQFRITRGALGFLAQQPGRCNKAARRQPSGTEFIARIRDSLQGRFIIKVVKFAFVMRVKSRQKCVA
jgi:hypothetical protein